MDQASHDIPDTNIFGIDLRIVRASHRIFDIDIDRLYALQRKLRDKFADENGAKALGAGIDTILEAFTTRPWKTQSLQRLHEIELTPEADAALRELDRCRGDKRTYTESAMFRSDDAAYASLLTEIAQSLPVVAVSEEYLHHSPPKTARS